MSTTSGVNLLERYLQAVGEYLPAASKADTLAELRANLLDQMEAREEELGRPLDETEVGAVLKAHGKPEVVALRYMPQRSLIGPTIFPFYVYTLRKALPLVLLVYAVAQAASLIGKAPSGDALAWGIARAVVQVIPTLLIFLALVTVVFAVIETTKGRERVTTTLCQWDPAKLPALRTATGAKQKSYTSRVVDLCVHILWMAYVLVLPRHPFLIIGPGALYLTSLGVGFAPVWHTFYVLLMALLLIQLGMKLMALRAGAQAWMQPMKLVAGAVSTVGLVIVACSKGLFVAVNARADMAQLASVNYAVLLAMRIALFFSVMGLLTQAWQYAKHKLPTRQLAF